MPVDDYDLLVRYWVEEPWGTWRDNAHAAIIAREVRRLGVKRGARVGMDDFMLVHPEKRGQTNVGNFVAFLKMMAGGKPTSKPKKRPPSGRRKLKKAVAARRKRQEVSRGSRETGRPP